MGYNPPPVFVRSFDESSIKMVRDIFLCFKSLEYSLAYKAQHLVEFKLKILWNNNNIKICLNRIQLIHFRCV